MTSSSTRPSVASLPWRVLSEQGLTGAALVVCVFSGVLIALVPEPAKLTLLLTLGSFAIVMLILRPIQSLGLIMAVWAPTVFLMMGVEIGSVAGVGLNLTRALGGAIIIGFSIRLIIRSSILPRLRKPSPPMIWYSVFAVLLLFSFLRSPAPNAAFSDLMRFTAGFLLLLVMSIEIHSSRQIAYLHGCAIVGTVGASALTVILWAAGWSGTLMDFMGITRAVGTFGNTNNSGHLAVFGIALLAPFLGRVRKSQLFVPWSFLLLLHVGALALTLSRGAMLGLLVFLVAWLVLDRTKVVPRHVRFAVVALAISSLLLGFVLQGTEVVQQRTSDITSVATSGLNDATGTGRIGIWRYQWRAYTQGSMSEIVLGQGLWSTMINAERMLGSWIRFSQVQGPHNEYIWLIVETGLVGLCVYLLFLCSAAWFFFKRIRNLPSDADAISTAVFLISFLAYMVNYQLVKEMVGWSITGMGIRWYFLLFLGLAFAACKYGTPYLKANDLDLKLRRR